MSQPDRLYIPPHTRLETVWREVDAAGKVHWQVWTACPDRGAPFNRMQGTFLYLYPTGMAERVTLRPDMTMDVMGVMPPCDA